MCKFFSFLTDPSTKKVYFFDAKTRMDLSKENPKHLNYDSHSSIAEFFGVDEDKLNKYEHNPYTKKLELDQQNHPKNDLPFAKKFVNNFNFSEILELGLFDLDLSSLTSVEGLVLPKEIGGHLNLSSLTSAEGLVLPNKIGGYLDLFSLTSAEGLVLPNKIGGYLDLFSLTSAEGLVLPKEIGGYLDLRGLTSAEGLVLPKEIGGHLDCPLLKND